MVQLDRRALLAGATLAGVAAAAGTAPARAAAPPAQRQAPGFYRLKVGTTEVTVISDGTLAFPAESLWKQPAADVAAALASEFRPAAPVVGQLNTIAVNTGDKLVLIDSGTGGKFQDTSGRLITNLAAAGYTPDQVDMIVFTHLHPDHLWGVSDKSNGALLFPNAEYVVTEVEHDFWAAPELGGKMPAGMKPMIDATQTNLGLVRPRYRPIKPGAEIVAGLHSVDTPGHTPGHASILISSGNDSLLVTGDVIFNAAISFQHPDWAIGFDMDPALAGKTRAAFLDRAVADRSLLVGYHLPFPAVGHVVRDGAAYRWIPAEWTWG